MTMAEEEGSHNDTCYKRKSPMEMKLWLAYCITSELEAEDHTGETKGKTSQIISQCHFETVDA